MDLDVLAEKLENRKKVLKRNIKDHMIKCWIQNITPNDHFCIDLSRFSYVQYDWKKILDEICEETKTSKVKLCWKANQTGVVEFYLTQI